MVLRLQLKRSETACFCITTLAGLCHTDAGLPAVLAADASAALEAAQAGGTVRVASLAREALAIVAAKSGGGGGEAGAA